MLNLSIFGNIFGVVLTQCRQVMWLFWFLRSRVILADLKSASSRTGKYSSVQDKKSFMQIKGFYHPPRPSILQTQSSILGPYFHHCSSSVHNCEDCFHIHVFIRSSRIWLSYFYSQLFITSRVYLGLTQWTAPSWLVSSVGRALHRYRWGYWFKSRTGLNFFMLYFHHFLRGGHNFENRFHLQSFISSTGQ